MDPIFCIISDLTITPLSLCLPHPLDCDTTPETYSVKKEMGEMSGILSTTHQPIYIKRCLLFLFIWVLQA